MKKKRWLIWALTFSVFLLVSASAGASACPFITVDENGNGTLDFRGCGGGVSSMPGVLAPDPGPGGLASVLTYNLLGPPSLTAGDLRIFDPDGTFADVIRFNPAGTGGPGYAASLLLYSNPLDGFDSLADTPSPPGGFYPNNLSLTESIVGGVSFVLYTPTDGQPGFVPGFSVTYDVISDVPEPSTLMLLGTGFIGAAGAIRRKLSS